MVRFRTSCLEFGGSPIPLRIVVWAWEAYGKGVPVPAKKIKHNKKLFYSLYLAMVHPGNRTTTRDHSCRNTDRHGKSGGQPFRGTGAAERERFSRANHLAGESPENQSSPNFGVTTIWSRYSLPRFFYNFHHRN